MMEVGNSRARAAYEANLPDSYRRPQGDRYSTLFLEVLLKKEMHVTKVFKFNYHPYSHKVRNKQQQKKHVKKYMFLCFKLSNIIIYILS